MNRTTTTPEYRAGLIAGWIALGFLLFLVMWLLIPASFGNDGTPGAVIRPQVLGEQFERAPVVPGPDNTVPFDDPPPAILDTAPATTTPPPTTAPPVTAPPPTAPPPTAPPTTTIPPPTTTTTTNPPDPVTVTVPPPTTTTTTTTVAPAPGLIAAHYVVDPSAGHENDEVTIEVLDDARQSVRTESVPGTGGSVDVELQSGRYRVVITVKQPAPPPGEGGDQIGGGATVTLQTTLFGLPVGSAVDVTCTFGGDCEVVYRDT